MCAHTFTGCPARSGSIPLATRRVNIDIRQVAAALLWLEILTYVAGL